MPRDPRMAERQAYSGFDLPYALVALWYSSVSNNNKGRPMRHGSRKIRIWQT
jgi:hypothetical protein